MKSAASVAFAAFLAVGLAGCGGLGGMFGGGSAAPAGADPTASSAGGGDSLANLLAFHTTNPGPVPAALPDPNKIQGCPDIEVQGGTAAPHAPLRFRRLCGAAPKRPPESNPTSIV
ncbi:MAG: hypothetical protein KGQ28_06830 [Hyphomicrobiales bacterium]|nr:hypothetical protein [Hyphomicrobiales bacterium]